MILLLTGCMWEEKCISLSLAWEFVDLNPDMHLWFALDQFESSNFFLLDPRQSLKCFCRFCFFFVHLDLCKIQSLKFVCSMWQRHSEFSLVQWPSSHITARHSVYNTRHVVECLQDTRYLPSPSQIPFYMWPFCQNRSDDLHVWGLASIVGAFANMIELL